jgi:hypothetical protein
MSNLLDILVKNFFPAVLEKSAQGWYEMLNLKGAPSGDMLAGMIVFKEDFMQKCKYTIIGRKNENLELVMSMPGLKSMHYEITDKISYEGFDSQDTTPKIITFKQEESLVKLILNPQDNLNEYFRLEIIPNEDGYRKFEKMNDEVKK